MRRAKHLVCGAVLLGGCPGPPPDDPHRPPPDLSYPMDPGVLRLTLQSVKLFRFTWEDAVGETEYRLLEDPDGASGYTPVATLPADTTSHNHPVFLPARIHARYILQACSSAGCKDSAPVEVSGTLAAAVGYLKASNTEASDGFGWAVVLSGDGQTLAVDAPGEASNATGIHGNQNDNSAQFSGAAYVFARSGTSWSQQAYLKASNTGAGDGFGLSVALSGDGQTLAVGAPEEASRATGIHGNQNDNSAPRSGAVYLF